MTDLRTLARALSGEVTGRGVTCPGPGHSPRDRSLSVMFSPSAPGGFIVWSHCGDDPLAAKDHVRQRLGISPRGTANMHAARANPRPDPVPPRPGENPSDRTAIALRIWGEAHPPAGSPVEAYLAHRGLALPNPAADVLRYDPACPFAGQRTPAMIALVRDVVTDAPIAIYRTALDRAAHKLADRVTKMRREPAPLLLEGGLAAKVLSATGREAQFHEARLRGMADVAAIFGVPLSVLGLGNHASYGSLTEESRALVRDCFRPWTRRIEAELVRSALTAEGRRNYTIAHDLSGLMAGDMTERFTAYAQAVQSEVLSSNECRAMEGLPPRAGGDAYQNPATSGRTTAPAQPDPPFSRGAAAAQPAEV